MKTTIVILALASAALAATVNDNEIVPGESLEKQRNGRIVSDVEADHAGLCKNMPDEVGCMVSLEAGKLRSEKCAKYGQGKSYHLIQGERNTVPIECQSPFCRDEKVKKKFSDGKTRIHYKNCGPGQDQMNPFYRPAEVNVCHRLREQGRFDPICIGVKEKGDEDDGPVLPPRTRPASSSKKPEKTAEGGVDDDDSSVLPPRTRPASSSKKNEKAAQDDNSVLPPRTRNSSLAKNGKEMSMQEKICRKMMAGGRRTAKTSSTSSSPMPANDGPQPVKLSLPLEYQQNLFQELRAEDELVVLARGLGLMRLVTNLLHSYDAAGNNLVVVVGADDRENGWMGEALAEHAAISGSPRARGLTVVNTDSQTVSMRQKMYAAGGIFSITSRILVVDLLAKLLDPESITGLVVLHADRVVATSTEAFIIRLYRQKNKAGFLKALSDNPEPMATGFSPLARTMRNLFVSKASLWPRFQVAVARSLEGKKKAEVIELEVPMTDSIRDMQNAILECVEVSIHELKKGNSGLDMDDWNLDNALLGNFDVMVRKQLEPNWHRVSWKTRQIVNDLGVLRALLSNVLTYDAVSFLQHLDTIHAAHSPPPGSTRQTQSPWLFLDAAQTLFDTARRRVYAAQPKDAAQGEDVEALRPVLEELPKWGVLAEVLEEMDRDMYLEPAARDDSNGTILIMCSSADTCRQLRDYLQTMYVKPRGEEDDGEDGRQASAAFMMRRRLRNYLLWKKQFARVSATLLAENQKALSGATDGGRAGRGGGRCRGVGSSSRAATNKRRRVRGGGVRAGVSVRGENGAMAQYLEKAGEVASLMAEVRMTEAEADEQGPAADTLEDVDDYFRLLDMQDLVAVHAYEGDQDEHVLEELKPRYVVMYEPDAGFIRRVEVYRSSHAARNVRVYFLYYGGSTEEQRYLSAVRREKDAFTKAIRERASMSLVMTAADEGEEDGQEALLRTVNTRIAGGGRLTATAAAPRVVVDVREFRSSLPCLLHGRAMEVVPCMLTVGDYILSPKLCVERKSISDLISSLRDGRLYSQAEAMFQHYSDPLLLIEFEENRAFTLEPFADLSGTGAAATTAAGSDLQAKLVLLTLAFPRLRIIWSSSPVQTAEMFAALKSQEHEPDPVAAVKAGLDRDEAADGGAVMPMTLFNREPREMLGTVPGVTAANVQRLVLETENVREVANMEVGQLRGLVGEGAARGIYGFFNRNVMEEEEEEEGGLETEW
ncbi:hypothetical protein L249_8272 [Ophiocordyceps polyrhachis-furcata BCC 54312]|uniref:ERCC4 domain-containing protein n=1 Tax=Ophiocordyceps polyrhachis-furcata BCC 54312 TaxID=1330021 RepID=A0A367LIC3_9HYPO|nr:hypothetical protein L249_8272 [Ophiocordyceps polyrhachis-furcata BCC 54312]